MLFTNIFIFLYICFLIFRHGVDYIYDKPARFILSLFNFGLLGILIYLTPLSFHNNHLKIIPEFIFFLFTQEIITYSIHFSFHKSKLLYQYIHRIHHLEKAENWLSAFFMSPLELMFQIYPSFIIPPLIINNIFGNINKITYELWTIGAIFFFLNSHVGKNSIVTSKFHWLHHKYLQGNYGSDYIDLFFSSTINK